MTVTTSIRDLEPFFFGEQSAPLYGCFHPPLAPRNGVAVVLCYPWGDEAIRVHRAYKQLALRLSGAGFPTLRFDYLGSGDSAGDEVEANLSHWEMDIERAIEEVRARAGIQQVVLIGLRLGASLALKVANRCENISGIVLWEPIVNGKSYFQTLTETHQSRLNYFLTDPTLTTSLIQGAVERLGFMLSSPMQSEIKEMNLLASFPIPANLRVLLVERAANELTDRLINDLQAQSIQTTYKCVDDPAIWGEDPDKALIPGQTFTEIMSWVKESFL